MIPTLPRGGLADDAKRLRDEYNMHRQAAPYDSIGKWLKVPLAPDGDYDHVLYDTKHDAVRHANGNERRFFFVQIVPNTMSGMDATTTLSVQRRLADAGMQMADPDEASGGRDVIKRLQRDDQHNQVSAMLGQGTPSNIIFRR